jgi:hypothetical protein
MFGRTFSLWRRWVRRSEEQAGPAAGERRVWVRYPANLETTYLPAEAEGSSRQSARVRDISAGGANLLVNRAFKPGELLSLELPVGPGELGELGEGDTSVLACVVRVVPQGKGEWALGCIFSRELSEDDLQSFGARREKHAPSDQRTWMRFPCNVKASYQRVANGDSGVHPAQVLNISANGVGLLVSQPIQTGTLLNVDMFPAGGAAKKTMLSCVVHVNSQGADQWALGCNFIRELNESDLNGLL